MAQEHARPDSCSDAASTTLGCANREPHLPSPVLQHEQYYGHKLKQRLNIERVKILIIFLLRAPERKFRPDGPNSDECARGLLAFRRTGRNTSWSASSAAAQIRATIVGGQSWEYCADTSVPIIVRG